jgi:hypothetical protein
MSAYGPGWTALNGMQLQPGVQPSEPDRDLAGHASWNTRLDRKVYECIEHMRYNVIFDDLWTTRVSDPPSRGRSLTCHATFGPMPSRMPRSVGDAVRLGESLMSLLSRRPRAGMLCCDVLRIVAEVSEAAAIVRIMGEGQFKLADDHFIELNMLDDELLAEMETGDKESFRRTLGALLDAVRRLGEPLPDDALEPSELILPAPDASLDEVREMLSDDGLIPG